MQGSLVSLETCTGHPWAARLRVALWRTSNLLVPESRLRKWLSARWSWPESQARCPVGREKVSEVLANPSCTEKAAPGGSRGGEPCPTHGIWETVLLWSTRALLPAALPTEPGRTVHPAPARVGTRDFPSATFLGLPGSFLLSSPSVSWMRLLDLGKEPRALGGGKEEVVPSGSRRGCCVIG